MSSQSDSGPDQRAHRDRTGRRSLAASFVAFLTIVLMVPLVAPAGALASQTPAMSAAVAPSVDSQPALANATIGPLGSGVLERGRVLGADVAAVAPATAVPVPAEVTPVESGEFAIELLSLGTQTLARGSVVSMMLINAIKGHPSAGVTEFIDLP
ncbi:MAG: hypothetical protein F2837_10250, partial [Actinobacteria bacterium]|nr:hypothetical protein [Actinomycetota bacterium]